MTRVIVRKSAYSYDLLKTQLYDILDDTCGSTLTGSSSVIIKPNLLSPAQPHTAVLTHPALVRVTAEYVLSKGAKPCIADSSAMGSFEKILKESGIKDALHGLDVEYREFRRSTTVDIGEPFGRIEIAEDAMKADVVINLAKLKTHSQMMLTLGVKNLFGCIVGFRKAEWHLRTGVDREMFAKLLVRICQAVRPSVTIVDGILALEGDGPGKGGTPIYVGALVAGENPFAVDTVICRMIRVNEDELLTNRIGKELGLLTATVVVDGTLPSVPSFRLPETVPLTFGPRRVQGLIRKHLLQRPVVNDEICELCGQCWEMCPADAITSRKNSIDFDYDRCVRCYCCIEVCPHGALRARETKTGRLLRRVIHKNE
jgi:uncharacterized protein (DUF362 family)/Pyruvate/2-oxoacid:ferredoxin oxidoreductase delta subunit